MHLRHGLRELQHEWLQILDPLLHLPTSKKLDIFLQNEKDSGHHIYPSQDTYFAALHETPWSAIRGIIIGQDPYHQPHQAHGLAFSVPEGQKIPPSLDNIFRELADDLHIERPPHGNLCHWSKQGILLLNTILTVQHNKPLSHKNQGWEEITDGILRAVCQQKEHLVIFAWGKYAQQKISAINTDGHLVLKAPHPSPLSSYRGFFGCRHFSQANAWWKVHGFTDMRWS
ncbi:uracil-DNA glycosylase [Chrysiogenes arsenatis]|uniref:uracil-DNA glycosylase n=1 Tax=Chrysiogenes arsenatis TaxID=309797 RepID=UPI00040FC562|nr:uracil-DNA glycosylase [Chrysiogenes arsenatis]